MQLKSLVYSALFISTYALADAPAQIFVSAAKVSEDVSLLITSEACALTVNYANEREEMIANDPSKIQLYIGSANNLVKEPVTSFRSIQWSDFYNYGTTYYEITTANKTYTYCDNGVPFGANRVHRDEINKFCGTPSGIISEGHKPQYKLGQSSGQPIEIWISMGLNGIISCPEEKPVHEKSIFIQ